jgi:hypothetical protein
MNFLLDFPRLKVFVNRDYMTDGAGQGREEAYVFAVTLLESRPLLFTVHTEFGAVYSRLPIQALAWKDKPRDNSYDMWGAISGNGTIVQHQYLKDYHVYVSKYKAQGRYWCTIDYYDGGFAQDPEQHKTTNIILANSGAILAVPNNECIFEDDHFMKRSKNLTYRRNKTYYTV